MFCNTMKTFTNNLLSLIPFCAYLLFFLLGYLFKVVKNTCNMCIILTGADKINC